MIPLKYYSIRFRRKKQHVNPDEGILPYLEYLIGDAAYDSIKAMKEAIGVALIPAIKLNRRRGKPRGRRAKISKFPKTEEGQKLFGLRGAIERANSFLKEGGLG